MSQTDTQEHDIIKILFAYVQQEGNTTVTFGKLVMLIKGYAQKFYKEKNSLIALAHDTEATLIEALEKLEANDQVLLRKNSNDEIITINYVGFHHTSIYWWYRKFDADIETPFLSKKQVGLSFPGNNVETVKIDQRFFEEFNKYEDQHTIIKMIFEHGLSEMMITPDIFCNQLELICLRKIGYYLEKRKNTMYLYQALQLIQEDSLNAKKVIETLANEPQVELQRIRNPTEKVIMLWTAIHGTLMNTLKEEDLSNASTQSFFQALVLIYHFALYYYNQAKKNQARERAKRLIGKKLNLSPFICPYEELITLPENASSQEKTVSEEDLEKEINTLSTQSTPDQPSILSQFIGLDGRRYLAFTKNVPTILAEQIEKTCTSIKTEFRNIWAEYLYHRHLSPTFPMEESALEHSIENLLREKNALLYVMLNYQTIKIALHGEEENKQIEEETYTFLQSLIEEEKELLIPYTEVFGIDLSQIKKEARCLVPFWVRIPGLASMISFIKKLFGTSKDHSFMSSKEKEPLVKRPAHKSTAPQKTSGPQASSPAAESKTSAKTTKATKDNDGVKILKEFVGAEEHATLTLRKLVNEWNPIVGEPQRGNLTKDINALCRDTLRSIWSEHMNQIPDMLRIQELSTRISQNRAFQSIKNRKKLTNYIELYLAYTIIKKLNAF